MAAYADYTYYTGTYLGTAIAEADFDALALRASEVIDDLTYDRAADETDEDVIDKIAMACCAVAEELQIQASESGLVQSESVGRHSVSYVSGSVRSFEQRQSDKAKRYLGRTGLMYRGFLSGEYGGSLADE